VGFLPKIIASAANKGGAPVAAAKASPTTGWLPHKPLPLAAPENTGLSVSADGRIKASPLAKKLAC